MKSVNQGDKFTASATVDTTYSNQSARFEKGTTLMVVEQYMDNGVPFCWCKADKHPVTHAGKKCDEPLDKSTWCVAVADLLNKCSVV